MTIVVTLAAMIASAIALAAPAGAINRTSCNSQVDQFVANAGNTTTCWANPGGASVALYHVVGQSAGNNAGCYNAINYQNSGASFGVMVQFYKFYNVSWLGQFYENLQFIYLNPAGVQTPYCFA